MYSTLVFLTLLLLNTARVVDAGLYVVDPLKGSVCRANRPCTVTWLDDGRAPLLSSAGVMTVGLYTGFQQLVQSIPPVNVATQRSLTFTPIPEAGPNSDTYYISFASTTLQVNGSAYIAYSPFFTLADMSGSFNSPLPPATSTKPIPSSLTQSQSSSSTSTITVGTLYTTPSLQRPTPTTTTTTKTTSTSSSIPRFTTSISSSSISSSPASSPSSTASQSGAVGSARNPTLLLSTSLLVSIILSWFLGMLYS